MSVEAARAPDRFRVLLVDVDSPLQDLLGEWLDPLGGTVVTDAALSMAPGGAVPATDRQPPHRSPARADLVIVDIRCPRASGGDVLRPLLAAHSGTPVIAVSSQFLPGAGNSGAVARALGVAAVLPKPVSRDALVNAVDRLLALT